MKQRSLKNQHRMLGVLLERFDGVDVTGMSAWERARAVHAEVADRLWAKVEKRGHGECWLWTGTTKFGYGILTRDGIDTRAHRIAYELEEGEIPEGWDVHHVCETRACVNPAHLKAVPHGLHSAHHAIGESNGRAKLSEDDVRRIRVMLRAGKSKTAIGREFDVDRTTIGLIERGARWSHVDASPLATPLFDEREKAA